MRDAFINIITRISNLITVKSIITLTATVVFAILSLDGTIKSEVFTSIFNIIIGFYFGTQKRDDTSKGVTDNRIIDTASDDNTAINN